MEVMSLCEATRTLPGAGGLLDQDPTWIERMKMYFELRSQKIKADEEIERQRANKRNR